MIKIDRSIVIDRPANDVFAYVSDQTNAPQWQSGIVEVKRLTDGPPGVGTRHLFVRTLMGKRLAGENEYIDFESGRRVTFRTTSGPGLVASYIIEPTPAGSRLTTRMELNVSRFMSIAAPLVAVALRRDVEANLRRLKDILEARA